MPASAVVGLAERRDAAVVVVIDAHVQPDLRHPLGVTHGAGPRADHLGGLRPAALDDDQRVEQFGFPIGAPARLAPGQRRQRRDHRPHVFRIDDHVAERRLHAPQAEQDVAVDAVIVFDAREQAGIFLGALLAGDDAPVRAAAVDVLPDLLGEFRLRAILLVDAGVGRERAHHAVVGLLRKCRAGCARARNPATQRAKAGVCAASACPPTAKLALMVKAPAIKARRLITGAEVPNRQNRGMRHCNHAVCANNRGWRAIRRGGDGAAGECDDAGAAWPARRFFLVPFSQRRAAVVRPRLRVPARTAPAQDARSPAAWREPAASASPGMISVPRPPISRS